MAKIKGSGKEIMERTLRKYGEDKVQAFYATFTREQLDQFQNVHGVKWVDLETDEINNSLQRAAKIVFPSDPQRLKKLGQAMAEHGFSVFYKVFFRLPSLTGLFKKVAAQWSQMYDTGRATVEEIEDHSAVIVIRDFRDLPAYLQEYLCGFYEGLMVLNGAKNPRVTKNDKNPMEWRWELKWD